MAAEERHRIASSFDLRKMSRMPESFYHFEPAAPDDEAQREEFFLSGRLRASSTPELSFDVDSYSDDGVEEEDFLNSSNYSITSSSDNISTSSLSSASFNNSSLALRLRTGAETRTTALRRMATSLGNKKAVYLNTLKNRSGISVKEHLERIAKLSRAPGDVPLPTSVSVTFLPKALIHVIDTETGELERAFWEPVDESAKRKFEEPRPLVLTPPRDRPRGGQSMQRSHSCNSAGLV